MQQETEQSLRRPILSIALLVTILMACATHAYRHLNLSGDEVHFYFLGMKDKWSDYRPFYERIREEFLAEDREPHLHMSAAQLGNFHTSEFYLSIQPSYFNEYKLPRMLWGTISEIVAPTSSLVPNDQALSEGLADSVFFMLMAGYLIACLLVVVITYRLSNFAKTVLLVFALVTFLRESFLIIDGESLFRGLSTPVLLFLSTPISGNKDMMTFGFSGRSLFLLLLAAYMASRWEGLFRRETFSFASYPLLPFLTLVHATHGVIVAGMFLVIDVLIGRRRLKNPVVLLSYAGSFGLALDGGLAAKPLAFAGLSLLTFTFLMASIWSSQATALGVTSGARTHTMNWRGEAILYCIFALTFILLVQPVTRLLGVQNSGSFWLALLGQRLGSIFGVLFLFVASWLAVDLVSRKLIAFRTPALTTIVFSAAIIPLVVAGIVTATDLSFDIVQVRARLRSHSAGFLAAIAQPILFKENNELHEIWYSIIKSSIHNKDYTVRMDSSGSTAGVTEQQ